MILRITPRNRQSVWIEIDAVCRGILPKRVLLPLYPAEFEGEISEDRQDELLSLLKNHAFNLLVDYLAQAEHSQLQCRNLLQRKKFDPTISRDAIERCLELNYLNDTRFARVLISSYINRKASKRAIVAKLQEQRVSRAVWEPLLEELFQKEEATENLAGLLAKYCVAHQNLPRPKLKEKAFSYLYRKGFDLEDIKAAWNELGRN